MSSCGRPTNTATDIIARNTPSAKTNADPHSRIGAYPILHSLPTISGPGLRCMPRRTGTRWSLYQEPPGDARPPPTGTTAKSDRDSDRDRDSRQGQRDADGGDSDRDLRQRRQDRCRGDRDRETETGATATGISDSDSGTDAGAKAIGVMAISYPRRRTMACISTDTRRPGSKARLRQPQRHGDSPSPRERNGPPLPRSSSRRTLLNA